MSASLADLIFGTYRRDVLALLLLHPEQALHVREIGRLTGKVPGTLLRELNRLSDAGVLTRKTVGNQVQFQADPSCPIFDDLRNILRKTAGVADLLKEALVTLGKQVQIAFVFGSVARGEETSRSDIDVLTIGTASLESVVKVLAPLQAQLQREINPVVISKREAHAKLLARDRFMSRIALEPKMFLIGTEDDFAELAENRAA
jgi:predicted nucleotidyltransferase